MIKLIYNTFQYMINKRMLIHISFYPRVLAEDDVTVYLKQMVR